MAQVQWERAGGDERTKSSIVRALQSCCHVLQQAINGKIPQMLLRLYLVSSKLVFFDAVVDIDSGLSDLMFLAAN